MACVTFFSQGSGKQAGCPTKRAPDVWDSAAFSSIFLASSFSCSQALSTPAHTQVTQTVGQVLALNLLLGFQNWLVFQIGV
jgi:hypothetical protein